MPLFGNKVGGGARETEVCGVLYSPEYLSFCIQFETRILYHPPGCHFILINGSLCRSFTLFSAMALSDPPFFCRFLRQRSPPTSVSPQKMTKVHSRDKSYCSGTSRASHFLGMGVDPRAALLPAPRVDGFLHPMEAELHVYIGLLFPSEDPIICAPRLWNAPRSF